MSSKKWEGRGQKAGKRLFYNLRGIYMMNLAEMMGHSDSKLAKFYSTGNCPIP